MYAGEPAAGAGIGSNMARILAVSSFVSFGTVGLKALTPALTALGHDVVELPTVVLSNHPGHAYRAGAPVSSESMKTMFDALSANGWIEGIDAIVSGYLPSAGHVMAVREIVSAIKIRRPLVPYVCDPVLGDDPRGLYIDPGAARAIKEELIAIADLTTPNRFEASYLTDKNVTGLHDIGPAIARLKAKSVVVTSVPGTTAQELANVLWSDGQLALTRITQRQNVPHGTGDLFCGAMLGNMMRSGELMLSLAAATSLVNAVLEASPGRDRLNLTALDRMASTTPAWPVEQG
jgi:pyridoxine kinase